jgi:hypothetical protein
MLTSNHISALDLDPDRFHAARTAKHVNARSGEWLWFSPDAFGRKHLLESPQIFDLISQGLLTLVGSLVYNATGGYPTSLALAWLFVHQASSDLHCSLLDACYSQELFLQLVVSLFRP